MSTRRAEDAGQVRRELPGGADRGPGEEGRTGKNIEQTTAALANPARFQFADILALRRRTPELRAAMVRRCTSAPDEPHVPRPDRAGCRQRVPTASCWRRPPPMALMRRGWLPRRRCCCFTLARYCVPSRWRSAGCAHEIGMQPLSAVIAASLFAGDLAAARRRTWVVSLAAPTGGTLLISPAGAGCSAAWPRRGDRFLPLSLVERGKRDREHKISTLRPARQSDRTRPDIWNGETRFMTSSQISACSIRPASCRKRCRICSSMTRNHRHQIWRLCHGRRNRQSLCPRHRVLLEQTAINPVVVHGGGPVATMLKRLGISPNLAAARASMPPPSRSSRWCWRARSTSNWSATSTKPAARRWA